MGTALILSLFYYPHGLGVLCTRVEVDRAHGLFRVCRCAVYGCPEVQGRRAGVRVARQAVGINLAGTCSASTGDARLRMVRGPNVSPAFPPHKLHSRLSQYSIRRKEGSVVIGSRSEFKADGPPDYNVHEN